MSFLHDLGILFTSPGTLFILIVPLAIWQAFVRMGLRNTQFLIICLLTGLAIGPSMLGGTFPGVMTFLFPHGLGGQKLASELAVVAMGFLAGVHIMLSKLGNTGNGGGTSDLIDEVPRAVIYGPLVIVVSVVSIVAQVALAFAQTPIIAIIAPRAVGTNGLLPFSLSIINPVIALPVLTAALLGIRLIDKKVGRVSIRLSVNSELYLWPSLILLTAYANSAGLAHGGSHTNFGFLTMIFLILLYIAVMFVGIKWLWNKITLTHEFAGLALTLPILIASTWITSHLGLHSLLGAVIAGLIAPHNVMDAVHHKEKWVQFGGTPFFLVGVGLLTAFQLKDLQVWAVAGFLTLTSGALQIALIAIMARWLLRFYPHKAWAIGWLATMRGMVEIVISTQLAATGLITPMLSQGVILMALIQTLIAPIAAKFILVKAERRKLAISMQRQVAVE